MVVASRTTHVNFSTVGNHSKSCFHIWTKSTKWRTQTPTSMRTHKHTSEQKSHCARTKDDAQSIQNSVRLSLERYFNTMAHNPFAFVSAPREMKSVRQTPVGAQQWSQKKKKHGSWASVATHQRTHLAPVSTVWNLSKRFAIQQSNRSPRLHLTLKPSTEKNRNGITEKETDTTGLSDPHLPSLAKAHALHTLKSKSRSIHITKPKPETQ